MKPEYIVLFFATYAFTGWLIELVYRSATQRRFVNPGFLFGPFVPVYGTGALLILAVESFIGGLHPAAQFAIYVVLLSVIEYLTGEIFERVFDLKLWDYSNSFLNINGKICLLFSVAWGALAMIVVYILQPAIGKTVYRLSSDHAAIASGLLAAYFIGDLSASVISLNRFRANLRLLYDKYLTLSNVEVDRILGSFRRILGAFPNLNRKLDENLSINIRQRLNAAMGKVADIVESVINERRPDKDEYNGIVRDILEHPEFLKLNNFFHHNSSIYEHARVVSYISYRACKYFNLDHVSAARGGLLHDFFLYDWRNHDEPDLHRDKYHGIEHPSIALENASKYFTINNVERDIIVKHMWPLTLVPPRYQESYIVTFVDKYVSSREFIEEFKKKVASKKSPKR